MYVLASTTLSVPFHHSNLSTFSLALITLVIPHLCNSIYRSSLMHRHIRRFFADYGMPLTVIAVSGLAYWGRFDKYVMQDEMRLPTGAAFQPANGREWLVRFWQLEGKYVGIALPFGLVLFILFYFDANVSVSAPDPKNKSTSPTHGLTDSATVIFDQSLIAQGSEFPLKKPPGFHWDFFLLGVTTFIAGLLGIPAPNGECSSVE